MRSSGVIVVLLCALEAIASLPARSGAAEQFPYKAYVNSEDVYIRSGPGKNYYATDKLAKGQPVEIYRHDPGGWYAIRPPEGSFSWVQADCLKPQGERLAVVEKDRAMCFVGTRFSSARDVHQVRLDIGEQVEIYKSISNFLFSLHCFKLLHFYFRLEFSSTGIKNPLSRFIYFNVFILSSFFI